MPIISYNRPEKNVTIEIGQYISLIHYYVNYLCLGVRMKYREGSSNIAANRLKKIIIVDNVTIDLLQGNNPRVDKILKEYKLFS